MILSTVVMDAVKEHMMRFNEFKAVMASRDKLLLDNIYEGLWKKRPEHSSPGDSDFSRGFYDGYFEALQDLTNTIEDYIANAEFRAND